MKGHTLAHTHTHRQSTFGQQQREAVSAAAAAAAAAAGFYNVFSEYNRTFILRLCNISTSVGQASSAFFDRHEWQCPSEHGTSKTEWLCQL